MVSLVHEGKRTVRIFVLEIPGLTGVACRGMQNRDIFHAKRLDEVGAQACFVTQRFLYEERLIANGAEFSPQVSLKSPKTHRGGLRTPFGDPKQPPRSTPARRDPHKARSLLHSWQGPGVFLS